MFPSGPTWKREAEPLPRCVENWKASISLILSGLRSKKRVIDHSVTVTLAQVLPKKPSVCESCESSASLSTCRRRQGNASGTHVIKADGALDPEAYNVPGRGLVEVFAAHQGACISMRFCRRTKAVQSHNQTLDVRRHTPPKLPCRSMKTSPPTASAGSGSNSVSSGSSGSSVGRSFDRSRCMKPECCQESASCTQQG